MRHRFTWLTLVLAAAIMVLGGPAWAQDEEPAAEEDDGGGVEGSGSVDLTFASNYTWRGQIVNEEPVLQGSVTTSIWHFSLNTWTNFDLTDGGIAGEFSEVDLTLSYAREFGPVSIDVGHVEYLFPNSAGGSTGEFYLATALDFLVSPSLTLAYDYGLSGLYANLGAGYGVGLMDWMSLDAGVSLGFATSDYNMGYFGVDKTGLNDLGVGVGLNFDVIGPFAISAGANFSTLLDSEISDAVDEATSIYGWLNLSVAP